MKIVIRTREILQGGCELSNRLKKVVPSLLMVLFGFTVILIIPYQIRQTNDTELGADFFPYLMGGLIVLLSLISMFTEFFKVKNRSDAHDNGKERGVEKSSYVRFILILIGLISWVVFVPIFGFVLTNVLITTGLMWVIGNRNPYLLFLVPVLLTAFLYYLFVVLLYVSFPEGLFY